MEISVTSAGLAERIPDLKSLHRVMSGTWTRQGAAPPSYGVCSLASEDDLFFLSRPVEKETENQTYTLITLVEQLLKKVEEQDQVISSLAVRVGTLSRQVESMERWSNHRYQTLREMMDSTIVYGSRTVGITTGTLTTSDGTAAPASSSGNTSSSYQVRLDENHRAMEWLRSSRGAAFSTSPSMDSFFSNMGWARNPESDDE